MKKVLIVYGTRYGITEEIAHKVAEEIEANELEPSLFKLNNVKQKDFPKINDYDGILEIDCSPFVICQSTVFQNLQQDVEHFRMCFFDFI